eukprot:756133-Hanusia_phi.AAC.1
MGRGGDGKDDYFDESEDKRRRTAAGDNTNPFLQMPSWDVIKRTARAFGGEERSAYPELFSSSKRGKGMRVLDHGQKTISYLNKVQLEIVEQEKEDDDMTMNLCRQLRSANLVTAVDPINDGSTPWDLFLKQTPPPEPTEDQEKERKRRMTYDYIGTLSMKEPQGEDLSEFIQRSIFVQERRTSTVEIKGEQPEVFARSAPPPPDAAGAGNAARPPREVQHEPKELRRAVMREEAPAFDINEWIRGSVFHSNKPVLRKRSQTAEELQAPSRHETSGSLKVAEFGQQVSRAVRLCR